MSKSSVVLFFLACFPFLSNAQQVFSNNKYPLVDFRPPLDIKPPALSGSFGEIRANHFHSGLDYRTNQREGYPVYAIADGYVSRIRVQNSGFGLAVYLNHPNGYTSVYGHLQRFNPKIAAHMESRQYEKKTFELDEFPQATLIPVRKGDIIGYSGNRGSSGGPHLHFEIRDTKTEATINPQLFGLRIPDHIAPVISALYVYKLNQEPFNEFTPKQYVPLLGAAGKYRLKAGTALTLGGEIGFGITVGDRHDGASGNNGVYSIQLDVDGVPVYISALEKFAFENSKAINSHIDYPAYIKAKQRIQKSFVDPGNPLQIYYHLVNRGRIQVNEGATHEVKYIISDASGNASTLEFQVKGQAAVAKARPANPAGILFPYAQDNSFGNEEVKVNISKGNLYNDLQFTYKVLPRPASKAYSAVHQIHNPLTPLHGSFDLYIKADSSLAPYADKAVIVNSNGASQGGTFENGYVKASPRTFGSFYITIDTIAPSIVPLNVSQGKQVSGMSSLRFKIRDQLSGIRSFNGYLDGQWVLMEFDAKTATLWHSLDERSGKGKHTLKIVVDDMKNNSKTYQLDFYR